MGAWPALTLLGLALGPLAGPALGAAAAALSDESGEMTGLLIFWAE